MSIQEERFYIADIYRTVEMEAYDILGRTIVLVRCVFNPNLRFAHLVPEREIPHSVYSAVEALQLIKSKADAETPIHFINDEPFLTAETLIFSLLEEGYKVHVNTNGFRIPGTYFLDSNITLYLLSRPGLHYYKNLESKAVEIRAYWHLKDEVLRSHSIALASHLTSTNNLERMVLVPHSPDLPTIHSTIEKAMELGCRVGLHPASLLPDVDKPLQGNPEAEEVIHEMQRQILAPGTKSRGSKR